MSSPYVYLADLHQQIPEIPDDSIVSRTIHSDDEIICMYQGAGSIKVGNVTIGKE